jgi:anti-sigma-K factor RskA
MALANSDQERIRRYLLGQLNDEDLQTIEERLMTENDLFQELEVSKDEIIEEYCAGELTAKEREWLEQHFLASPEGKVNRRFALALNQSKRKSPRPETFFERLKARFSSLWNSQPWAVAAIATAAVVLVVAGIVLRSTSQSTPGKLLALTLNNTSATRTGDSAPTAKVSLPLNVDELRITLVLPESSPSASSYRVEAVDGINTLSVAGSNSNSVSVIIPAAQLRRGQYALRLYAIKADGTEERVTGNYFFTVE